jgi:hypothetical protein
MDFAIALILYYHLVGSKSKLLVYGSQCLWPSCSTYWHISV